MYDVLDPRDLLEGELDQCRESGRDIAPIEAAVRAALADGSAADRRLMLRVLGDARTASDWPYDEPSSLEAIAATLSRPPRPAPLVLAGDALRDRLLAAWSGRVAGCILGKPVEGWGRAAIRTYLEAHDAYPLTAYLPPPRTPEEARALMACWTESTAGNIAFAARDDDIDYTILGVHILEEHGFGFGPEHVADRVARPLPVHAGLHRRTRGLPQPGARHAAARDGGATTTPTASGSAPRSAPTPGATCPLAAPTWPPRSRSRTPASRTPPTASTARCGQPP